MEPSFHSINPVGHCLFNSNMLIWNLFHLLKCYIVLKLKLNLACKYFISDKLIVVLKIDWHHLCSTASQSIDNELMPIMMPKPCTVRKITFNHCVGFNIMRFNQSFQFNQSLRSCENWENWENWVTECGCSMSCDWRQFPSNAFGLTICLLSYAAHTLKIVIYGYLCKIFIIQGMLSHANHKLWPKRQLNPTTNDIVIIISARETSTRSSYQRHKHQNFMCNAKM